MLKLQVEFSRLEGSIDVAFLNFKNETEFLQKFLSLTMDEEQTSIVRNSVATACDKFKKKPEFQNRLNILNSLHDKLQIFQSAAQVLLEAKLEISACRLEGINLISGLLGTVDSYNATSKEKLGKIEIDTKEKELLQEERLKLEERLTYIKFEHLGRNAEATRLRHESFIQDLQQTRERLFYCRAAQMFSQILSTKAKISDLHATKELAEAGLKPFEEFAKQQGAIYKTLLERAKTALETSAQLAKQKSEQEKNLYDESANRLKEIALQKSSLEQRKAKLNAKKEQYEESRKEWFRKKILNFESERLSDAIGRNDAHLAQIEQTKTKFEGELKNCQAASKELERKLSSLSADLAAKQENEKYIREQVAKAESLFDMLKHNRFLCRAAESDCVDPDSDLLLISVNKFLSDAQRNRDSVAVAIALLHKEATEISTNGVASSSPDVEKVLAALLGSGVRSASAFGTYIANTMPDPILARSLVLSNPSRFLGIAVKTEKELERAKEIMKDPPSLAAPVVISLITTEKEPETKHCTVGPENDSKFNFASAQDFGQQIRSRLDKTEGEFQTIKLEIDALVDARSQLLKYQLEYGVGKFESLRRELVQAVNSLKALNEERSFLNEELAERESERERIFASVKNTEMEISKQNQTLRLLERDHEMLEKPVTESLTELITLESELQSLTSQQSSLEEIGKKAQGEYMSQLTQSTEMTFRASKLDDEILTVSHWDSNFEVEATIRNNPISLEDAKNQYNGAASTLHYQERERLGVVARDIELAQERLDSQHTDYRKRFPSIDVKRVEEAMRLDFESEILALESAETAKIPQTEKAGTDSAIAKRELEQFLKVNASIVSSPSVIATLTDDQISEELYTLPESINSIIGGVSALEERLKGLEEEVKDLHGLSESLKDIAEGLTLHLGVEEEIESSAPLSLAGKEEARELTRGIKKKYESTKTKFEHANEESAKYYRSVEKVVGSSELIQAEPEIALYLSAYNVEQASNASEQLTKSVEDRIQIIQSWLDSVQADFDATVEELHHLVNDGIRVLTLSCNKLIPESAPYLGGKPVLKMRVNLHGIPTEHRRFTLSQLLDSIITSGLVYKSGTDLVAAAIQKLVGKSLGLFIAKLTRDESEQYAPIDKLSNSGGEAVSMALFLYILTAQARAEMQADTRRAPGGPLILDNPFAKASSPFIWRAQRAFARAMGVQLIFATGINDIDTLGEFEHFIYLRDGGVNSKSGRHHIEHVELSLKN